MKISIESVANLLHHTSQGALASHSIAMPGYPFASAIPFVTDQDHCPVFLLSHLAEHQHNLQADPRASLLVQATVTGEVEAGARMTLMGEVQTFNPDPLMLARYLRQQPAAQRYLELSGFEFYRLQPSRIRLIAGFGQMGWVEAQDWQALPCLSLKAEAALLQQCTATHGVIGLDCYGVDLLQNGKRSRLAFASRVEADALETELKQRGLLQ